MKAILSTQKLQLSIAGQQICGGLDWAVSAGEVWGVLGVNGIGKSTLLHALAGLRPVDHGVVLIGEAQLDQMSRRTIARKVGLLFQHQEDVFPATVEEVVSMGRHPHASWLRGEQPEDVAMVEQVMGEMGLSDMRERLVDTLSGGERRRVAVATLLAQQPQLYLLDEPEAHLDPAYQKEIFARVKQQAVVQEAAVVMVLHDINLAIHHCTHLLMLMRDGDVEQGAVEGMATPERVEQLYGTAMRRIEEEGRIAYLSC